jgi:hypothetical protein
VHAVDEPEVTDLVEEHPLGRLVPGGALRPGQGRLEQVLERCDVLPREPPVALERLGGVARERDEHAVHEQAVAPDRGERLGGRLAADVLPDLVQVAVFRRLDADGQGRDR